MMKTLSIVSCLTLFHLIYGQERIAGHVLFRHGDRTPISTYPTDPMKEQDWPNGYGQLTSIGIEQHYHLGKYFRTRYQSILSSKFDPKEIFVRSTDYDRTLMSAQANLVGLYPSINNSVNPIPIHTQPSKDDFLLGINNCPKYDEIENNVYRSDEFKTMNAYYTPFFEKLQLWTNISNITLYNAWEIADTIFVENKYNKTPAWADEGVRKNLTDISDRSFHFLFLNNDTKRIRGGPVIQDIWMNMNNAIHGGSHQKFRMYSAHDTTISAALAFLGVNWPHQPSYACSLLIDLYQQNSSYFVTVAYVNVTGSNDPHEFVLNGCLIGQCPFNIFTSIYQSKFPASSDVECSTNSPAPPPSGGDNNKTIAIVVSIAIIFGIIILVLFIWLFKRRNENGPALLSSDAYQTVA